ncbi:MAG TPA: hypothetical protein VLT88_16585 [Desulfosarcina sp.]|nr:hypothetical protein [Desulfosarcina sp.]
MPRTDGTTHWERDLLIAHRILAPVIAAQGDDIDLWRFHRRSADDGAGHQFSLIFYASAQTADEINRKVAADTLLEALLRAGVIDAVITDDVGRNDRPQVGDTSDASWSPVMQRTWPYYIMGVSRMWLAMIEALSGEVGTAGDVDLQDHYREVNRRLTYIWQHEGQHALLHHLNAVFGYEAMLLRETRWKSF